VYAIEPYTVTQTDDARNSFDLHGHDLKVSAFLDRSIGNANKYLYLQTEEDQPCTVSLIGDRAGSTLVSSVEFRGPVSLVVDNGAVNCFTSRVSQTTGTLTVKNGTLAFSSAGGWSGTNAVVKAGATLSVAAESTARMFVDELGDPQASLVLEDDSSIALGGGVTKVTTLTVNGELQYRGSYNSAKLSNITGPGRLKATVGEALGLLLIFR